LDLGSKRFAPPSLRSTARLCTNSASYSARDDHSSYLINVGAKLEKYTISSITMSLLFLVKALSRILSRRHWVP
jgi:hypothetical protein